MVLDYIPDEEYQQLKKRKKPVEDKTWRAAQQQLAAMSPPPMFPGYEAPAADGEFDPETLFGTAPVAPPADVSGFAPFATLQAPYTPGAAPPSIPEAPSVAADTGKRTIQALSDVAGPAMADPSTSTRLSRKLAADMASSSSPNWGDAWRAGIGASKGDLEPVVNYWEKIRGDIAPATDKYLEPVAQPEVTSPPALPPPPAPTPSPAFALPEFEPYEPAIRTSAPPPVLPEVVPPYQPPPPRQEFIGPREPDIPMWRSSGARTDPWDEAQALMQQGRIALSKVPGIYRPGVGGPVRQAPVTPSEIEAGAGYIPFATPEIEQKRAEAQAQAREAIESGLGTAVEAMAWPYRNIQYPALEIVQRASELGGGPSSLREPGAISRAIAAPGAALLPSAIAGAIRAGEGPTELGAAYEARPEDFPTQKGIVEAVVDPLNLPALDPVRVAKVAGEVVPAIGRAIGAAREAAPAVGRVVEAGAEAARRAAPYAREAVAAGERGAVSFGAGGLPPVQIRSPEVQALGFRSALEDALNDPKTPNVQRASDWLRQFTGRGVKQEELEKTGVGPMLDELKRTGGSASREDIALQAKSKQVVLEERILGEGAEEIERISAEANKARARLASYGGSLRRKYSTRHFNMATPDELNEYFRLVDLERATVKKIHDATSSYRPTRYEGYTLPGHVKGSDREILLRAPGLDMGTGHFGREGKDVVVWARVNDRIANGRKILSIEEIQSDTDKAARAAHERLVEDLASAYGQDPTMPGLEQWLLERATPTERIALEAKGYATDAVMAERERLSTMEVAAYEAPIRDEATIRSIGYNLSLLDTSIPVPPVYDYERLMAKRLLMYATEKGYDEIQWTTGAQQIQRWETETRRLVKKISYEPAPYPKDVVLYIEGTDGRMSIETLPLRGRGALSNSITATLDDLLGKAMASKVRATGSGVLEGEGLNIGGGGMIAAYDKRIPSIIDSIVKESGGRAGYATIPGKINPAAAAAQLVETLRRAPDKDALAASDAAWDLQKFWMSDSDRGIADWVDRWVERGERPDIAQRVVDAMAEVKVPQEPVHSLILTEPVKARARKGYTLYTPPELGGAVVGGAAAYDPNATPEENARRMAAGIGAGTAGMGIARRAAPKIAEAIRRAPVLAEGLAAKVEIPPSKAAEAVAAAPAPELSAELRRLHDSPVRKVGFEAVNDAVGRQFLRDLRTLAEKHMPDKVVLVDEAEEAYDIGARMFDTEVTGEPYAAAISPFGEATVKSERVIQARHTQELQDAEAAWHLQHADDAARRTLAEFDKATPVEAAPAAPTPELKPALTEGVPTPLIKEKAIPLKQAPVAPAAERFPTWKPTVDQDMTLDATRRRLETGEIPGYRILTNGKSAMVETIDKAGKVDRQVVTRGGATVKSAAPLGNWSVVEEAGDVSGIPAIAAKPAAPGAKPIAAGAPPAQAPPARATTTEAAPAEATAAGGAALPPTSGIHKPGDVGYSRTGAREDNWYPWVASWQEALDWFNRPGKIRATRDWIRGRGGLGEGFAGFYERVGITKDTPATNAVLVYQAAMDIWGNGVVGARARLLSKGTSREIFGTTNEGLVSVARRGSGYKSWVPILDVMEQYKKYNLTPQQLEWVGIGRKLIEDAKIRMRQNKIPYPSSPTAFEGEYWPRKVMGKRMNDGTWLLAEVDPKGSLLSPGDQPFDKRRVFNTADEGFSQGFRYLDPEESLEGFMQGVGRKIAIKQTTDYIKEVLPHKWTAAHVKFTETTLPMFKTKLISIKPADSEEFIAMLKEVFPRDDPNVAELRRLLGIEKLSLPSTLNQPHATVIGAHAKQLVVDVSTSVKWPATIMRSLITNVDISAPMLQLMVVASLEPKAFGKAVWEGTQSLISEAHYNKVLAELADPIRRGAEHHLIVTPSEFGEIAQAPYIGKVMKPFARGYDAMLNIARVKAYEATEYMARTPRDLDELASFWNNATGVANMSLKGISQNQQAVMTALLFAKNYRYATIAVLSDMFKGGIRGKLARKAMFGTLGHPFGIIPAGFTGFVGVSMLMGQNPLTEGTLDPVKYPGRWMTVRIGNNRVGLGGAIPGMLRLTQQLALTAMRGEPLEGGSFIAKHLRNLSMPLVGNGLDYLLGRDQSGRTMASYEAWQHVPRWFIKDAMFSWAQEAALDTLVGKGVTWDNAVSAGFQMSGARVPELSPADIREEIRLEEIERALSKWRAKGGRYANVIPETVKSSRYLMFEVAQSDPEAAERMDQASRAASEEYSARGSLYHKFRVSYTKKIDGFEAKMNEAQSRLDSGKVSGNWYRAQISDINRQMALVKPDLFEANPEWEKAVTEMEERIAKSDAPSVFKDLNIEFEKLNRQLFNEPKLTDEDIRAVFAGDVTAEDQFVSAWSLITEMNLDKYVVTGTGDTADFGIGDVEQLIKQRDWLKGLYLQEFGAERGKEIVDNAIRYINRNKNPEYVKALEQFSEFMKLPKYQNMVKEASDDADEVRAYIRQLSGTGASSVDIEILAKKTYGSAAYAAYRAAQRKGTSIDRKLFRASKDKSGYMRKYFGDVPGVIDVETELEKLRRGELAAPATPSTR